MHRVRGTAWVSTPGQLRTNAAATLRQVAGMTSPESARNVFSVTAAGSDDLSYEATRSSSFLRPSRGVRVAAGALGEAGVAESAAVVAGAADAVVCDVAAARLWQLPLPPWIGFGQGPVSVAVPPGRSHPRRRGVRGRRLRLPDGHVTEVDGLRVTSPARTWMDCAAVIPFDYLVAMGDAILHRRLAEPGAMQDLSQWGYRRRGIVAIRAALLLLDDRAESPGESRARVLLIGGGIRPPLCNHNVVQRGRWIARVDMAWEQEKVIVEYDGAVHLEEGQRRRDAQRLNLLQAAGWRVIVLTADDLRRPEATIALVKAALAERLPRG